MEEYEKRFAGVGRLLGADALQRLRNAHATVIGVGGVGSWAVEALARSGVGALTLIDMDDVCITNINRQLPALTHTVGMPKVHVLAERVRTIWPGCDVRAVPVFLSQENAAALLATPCDVVLDAVDRTVIKSLIIAECVRLGRNVVTVGGAGGKCDPTQIRTGDLAFSHGDEMLRQVRRELRRHHGFPGDGVEFGVGSIFSAEKPRFPWSDGSLRMEPEKGTNLKLDCSSGFGTAAFVTGAFGFAAAGEVIRRMLQ